MATKEPDRPNPNPELKMPPSQTKIMEQCQAEAEAKYPLASAATNLSQRAIHRIGEFDAKAEISREAYTQALFDERSKRPTVEQVMEVVDDELWTARDRLDDGGSPTNEMMCALGAISSRLTKLLNP